MSKNTIYCKACNEVAGFKSMGEEFVRKLVINGKAKSTHENYLRQMAKMALHFGKRVNETNPKINLSFFIFCNLLIL